MASNAKKSEVITEVAKATQRPAKNSSSENKEQNAGVIFAPPNENHPSQQNLINQQNKTPVDTKALLINQNGPTTKQGASNNTNTSTTTTTTQRGSTIGAGTQHPNSHHSQIQQQQQQNMHMVHTVGNTTHLQPDLMQLQEASPAYHILHEHKLLTTKYRLKCDSEIDCIKANSTQGTNYAKRGCLFVCCFAPGVMDNISTRQFTVKDGNIRPADDGNGNYLFFGPGVHRHVNPFLKIGRKDVPLTSPVIKFGNRTIVTIPQGSVGLAMDRGQPVLLPPGLHQWMSNTMYFEKNLDLSEHVIEMGPYTLLTVDEGYAAVTQDNGMQKILDGGETYMLTHRNWRFEKFLTCKIQTNDLRAIRATTADNIHLETSATVNWIIKDIACAAKMAAETMHPDGKPVRGEDIRKLREDVLQQAIASVSAFIGKVRYSDATAVASSIADGKSIPNSSSSSTALAPQQPPPGSTGLGMGGAGFLFDSQKIHDAVDHANNITKQYGVEIISINIISAFPADKKLMEALAAGAVAAAEAEQAELGAIGQSKALQISSKAEADAERIKAQGDADANRIRAKGAIDAAKTIEMSDVAIDLAKIEKTGDAVGQHSTFFFGANAKEMGSLLANPNVIQKQ